MAEYKYQKLFHNSLINDQEYTRVYDAVYAYSIKYPSTDHSTPGRYRIRIVKYDGPADEFVPSPTLVGNLDKWSDKGWQHCLEWFGDPKTNFKKGIKLTIDWFSEEENLRFYKPDKYSV